jgi:L-threonylcarbamoyladenylate synthase
MVIIDSFDTLIISQALVKKKLVCLPTDTLYALCADAGIDEAVKKVYIAKRRNLNKALPIFVSSIEQAQTIGIFNDDALKLANKFWPGPLTIVVPLQEKSSISSLVTAKQNSIAIRIPAHKEFLSFLEIYGKPITATSANISQTANDVSEAEIIRSMGEHIEVFVRAKDPLKLVPSTIVSCVEKKIQVLREGVISLEEINI